MKLATITTPDGVRLSTREGGDPAGAAIVFMHGLFQSALAWHAQFAAEALSGFRLIAYDMRGHGGSDKPADAAYYREPRRWADEVKCVLDAFVPDRAIVVAWSYAGGVLGEYLNHYGHERIAAINFVGASTRTAPEWIGPARAHVPHMLSDDIEANIAATRAFVRGCYTRQPAPEDIETAVAYNMLVPVAVRRALVGRPIAMDDALAALDVPVLVSHGADDAVVLQDMGAYTARAVHGARLSLYATCGHCVFAEDARRFNRELAELARVITSKG